MSRYPSVLLPGYLASSREYEPMQQLLEQAGYPTRLVPLTLRSWIPTLGGRPVTPILQALADTIAQTQQEFQTDQVNVIAHSAGGWIARIYLGSVAYHHQIWAGETQVATLITLGTPHRSQERWTLSNLNFVNQNYPGACCSTVKYVCVAGDAVQGRRWGSFTTWLAYSSYQLTDGEGTARGDGITPIAAAHLEGAINLTVPECYHSPRSRGKDWYGSERVLPDWMPYLD